MNAIVAALFLPFFFKICFHKGADIQVVLGCILASVSWGAYVCCVKFHFPLNVFWHISQWTTIASYTGRLKYKISKWGSFRKCDSVVYVSLSRGWTSYLVLNLVLMWMFYGIYHRGTTCFSFCLTLPTAYSVKCSSTSLTRILHFLVRISWRLNVRPQSLHDISAPSWTDFMCRVRLDFLVVECGVI